MAGANRIDPGPGFPLRVRKVRAVGLYQERNGLLALPGPGTTLQVLLLLLSLILTASSVLVPWHEGNASWHDLPPFLMSLGLTVFIGGVFQSDYLVDGRRREISRRYGLLGVWSWTRKLADFSDIRGTYLTQPESTTTRSAMLEVLLPSGRVLELRLGNEQISRIEESVQAFYRRFQIEPGAGSRTAWELPEEYTGCLVSFMGCATPCALGLLFGLIECFIPSFHPGLPPALLWLLLSMVFMGPFSDSGWRAVPAENRLERFFRLGPWSWRKNRSLDGYTAEVQRVESACSRPYQLVLQPGVMIDQFATQAEADAELERYRQQLP